MKITHVLGVALALAMGACATTDSGQNTSPAAARYRADANWPRPLPNNWILGQVAGVWVDGRDHVWIVHRPLSIQKDELYAAQKPPASKCCLAAPPVVEFDPAGNLVQAWGGPGQGYDWPKNEHGIHVDSQGNVWVAGNDPMDNQVLKFTRDGKFLLQIGKPGKSEGSNSRTQLGRPAHMDTDLAANELFVADGYGNRRVVVFDAQNGAYKRHWGAYGGVPHDEKLPAYDPNASGSESFTPAVHCVRIARDGLLYVCDRGANRIQVFQKDGTFVKEFFVQKQTRIGATTAEIAFSPDPQQTFIYVADAPNGEVQVLTRADGKPVGSFGRIGPMAGQFRALHNIASDSRGNIYTTEAGVGRRVQRFVRD